MTDVGKQKSKRNGHNNTCTFVVEDPESRRERDSEVEELDRLLCTCRNGSLSVDQVELVDGVLRSGYQSQT